MRSLCGVEYLDTDGEVTHVCTWPNEKLLSPDYTSRVFKRLLEEKSR